MLDLGTLMGTTDGIKQVTKSTPPLENPHVRRGKREIQIMDLEKSEKGPCESGFGWENISLN